MCFVESDHTTTTCTGPKQPEEEKAAAAGLDLDLGDASRRVQESCAEAMAAVRGCKGEAACAQAAVGLTLCMAKLLCPEEARGFNSVWAASGGGSDPKHEAAIEASFARMRTCLDDFEKRAREQRRKK